MKCECFIALLRGSVGKAAERKSDLFRIDKLVAGITFSAATPLNPAEITAMHSKRNELITYFSIGYRF